MRSTILAIATAFIALGGSVFAQDALPKAMEQAKPITIRMTNAPVSELFRLLGAASGVEIRTQGDDRPVTVKFTDARVVDVFNFLVTAGHLTYSVVGEKTIIVTVPTAAP